GSNGTHDSRCHLILKLEDILQRPLEPVGPEVGTGRAVNKLSSDTHFAARLAHAAFEDVANAEVAPDLSNIGRLSLVGERRISGATNSDLTRDSAVVMSSTIPSAKYSCSGSPLMFWNGRTAMEGLVGNVRLPVGGAAAPHLSPGASAVIAMQ